MYDNYQYVKNLVQTNYRDYKQYVCNQVINQSSSYQNNIYDIYCGFGNDLVFSNYRVSNIKKLCKIDISTSYYNSNVLERIACDYNTSTYLINNYDYIYTNISEIYPSILSDFEIQKDNNLSYNQNFMYLIPFCILLVFLALFWFRK